jgi:hypothetical protein
MNVLDTVATKQGVRKWKYDKPNDSPLGHNDLATLDRYIWQRT